MQMPDAYWRMTYQADRRKHRHRCVWCNCIVQPGEEVFMARIDKGTKVLHVEGCADAKLPEGHTRLELLECHGMSYLARCGWKQAQDWLDASPLTKTRLSSVAV